MGGRQTTLREGPTEDKQAHDDYHKHDNDDCDYDIAVLFVLLGIQAICRACDWLRSCTALRRFHAIENI